MRHARPGALAVRFALLCSAVILGACAGSQPAAAPEPAHVAVEVLSGAPVAPPPPPAAAIVIDASASMGAPAASGISRLAAAQTRAREVVASLSPASNVMIDVVGGAGSDACAAPVRLPPLAAGVGATSAALAKLSPGGDAAFAAALRSAAQSLAAKADGGRIVAFTDLEDDCGGDLCAAISEVVAAGASLDLVVLADRPTPSCVVKASASVPATLGVAQPASPVRFEIVPVAGSAIGAASGGPPVRVAAGPVRIVIALTPPLEIGPVTLTPGALVRVRVLDFPAAVPPIREWSLDLVGAGGDLAGSPAVVSPPGP